MTAKKQDLVLQQRTTLVSLVVALAAVLGGVLLLLGENWMWGGFSWQTIIHELGAFLLVAGLIGIFWETAGKRLFRDEVLSTLNISTAIDEAGIIDFAASFNDPFDWRTLFASSSSLRLLLAYGRTWRNARMDDLRAFVMAGGSVRVVLPDPRDEFLLGELARRFSVSVGEIAARITESVDAFKALGPTVEIWFSRGAPVYSLYIFDEVAVMSPYSHRRDKASVPRIVCRRGGSLFAFLAADWEAVTGRDAEQNGMTRRDR